MELKELFCSLLRDALWERRTRVEASADMLHKVVQMSKTQTVLGLIANELLVREEFSSLLTPEFKDRLNYFAQGNLFNTQKLNMALVSLVRELRKHGIDSVLLKGQGLARNYPIPELRQCGDIDLYVGVENYEKACGIAEAMSPKDEDNGQAPKSQSLNRSVKHFNIRMGRAYTEIHRFTDVYFPKRIDKVYQRISDEAMSGELVTLDFYGEPIKCPSADFNAFFIFNHFWHHFISDGVGLRQICDWALFLHANRDKLNEEYLADVLGKMKYMKQWQVFGFIAVEYLGLPKEEMPFYTSKYKKCAARVFDLIMVEGNFGHENYKTYNRPKGYISGKLYTFYRKTRRYLRILRIFPKEAVVQNIRLFASGVIKLFEEQFSKS